MTPIPPFACAPLLSVCCSLSNIMPVNFLIPLLHKKKDGKIVMQLVEGLIKYQVLVVNRWWNAEARSAGDP
jgi:uncharacterized protein YqhQ